MLLIGQFDSPFVRRVGIALRLYGLAFDHEPWSSFGDAAKIARYNPATRVPTLVLDGDEVLIESGAILDHLDETAATERRLIAAHGPERRRALKTCALATGLADKAVSLVYEHVLHPEPSQAWIARCTGQITAILGMLEAERGAAAAPFWFGAAPGHADIAVACAVRFLREAHPEAFADWRWPGLAAHSARCEGLPAFREISQAFIAPRS